MNKSVIPILAVFGLTWTAPAADTAIPEKTTTATPVPALVDLQTGKITFIGGDGVKISGSGQPAKNGDSFPEKTELETGTSPVTEVTFGDGSVMRLGENTKVSYSAKERIVRLMAGTVLFHSVEGQGGITVQGAQASGQVTGSTVMGTQDSSGNFSFLLLESTGAGSVTGGTAGPTFVGVGEMTTIRAGSAEPPQVVEVHVDAVRDISPLFQQIPSSLPSATKVVGTTEQQAMEIQTDIKLLSSLDNFKLTEIDPEGLALAMICGVGQDEMGASKNILLRPVDTAAGTETAAGESSSGTPGSGSSFGTLVAMGMSDGPMDARQEEAASLIAASAPSGDGLAGTDTAAGGEGGGDLGATETAAGGGGGADTQAPITPAAVNTAPPPVTSSPLPGLTTPV